MQAWAHIRERRGCDAWILNDIKPGAARPEKQQCGFDFVAHNSRQKWRQGIHSTEYELSTPCYALCNQSVMYTCN